jgi:dCMP deaminase
MPEIGSLAQSNSGEPLFFDMRRDKINYYLDIAQAVSQRGTCLRRNYGALIVKNDEIVSSGYTGAPRGRENCNELGYCIREQLNIARGTMYEKCRSVHAEANAIISASRNEMLGSVLYLVGTQKSTSEYVVNADSCSMCKRMIINSGIEKVIIRIDSEKYKIVSVDEWIRNDDSLSAVFGY